MHAQAGDKIMIEAHHIGEPRRDCVIVEVRGEDGQPPYVVQWADVEHETLFYPGPDASIVPYAHPHAS